MLFNIGCRLTYWMNQDTPFVFNIEAQAFPGQTIVSETLKIGPQPIEPERWTMPDSGNRYFRINASPGRLEVDYDAQIHWTPIFEDPAMVTEVPLSRLPLSVLLNLYPSRYCQSDKLERFARSTFGKLDPGYTRVNGICDWIHDYVAYEGGSTNALTSAFDTVTQRAGVCRDFAHLGIALCRTLGIPARYASVYASRLYPPDFHAVFEAFLEGPEGGGWYLFDPTRLADIAGLIRIGVGRDAAEVAFCDPYAYIDFAKPEVWITPVEAIEDHAGQAVRSQGLAPVSLP